MRLFVRTNLMQWVTMAGLIASLHMVRAQTEMKSVQSTSADDRAATTPAAIIPIPHPAEPVTSWEIFCPALFPDLASGTGDGSHGSEERPDDNSSPADGGRTDTVAAPARLPGSADLRLGNGGRPEVEDSPTNRFRARRALRTNPGETNGVTVFQLHDSPGEDAHETWANPDLIVPSRKIGQDEAWSATNQEAGSQIIPVYGPVNLLCHWRRDSTGNFGLFLSAATTNSRSGTIYSGRIGVRSGGGPYGGHPFIIQGGVSF